MQFVELIGTKDDQELLGGHLLTSNSSSYTFIGHLPASNTDGRSVLVATTAFADLPGAPTPDYILPDSFLSFQNDTINYGADTDVVGYGLLPTDGSTSIDRNGTPGTNSPRNFAGVSGSIDASVVLGFSCGDGNVDTGEACDDGNTASGDCCSANCQFEGSGMSCNDNNACTSGDACDGAGICAQGTQINCNDGNDCTTNSCNTATGCTIANEPAGSFCSDANICTNSDTCDGAGSCQAESAVNCDDGDECTADGCDGISGCFHSEILGCAALAPLVPSVPSLGLVPRSLLLMAILGFGAARLRGKEV